MNTFLHLPFPSRPRHDSLVRISYFSTCFQNRLLFRLTANLDTRMKTWEVFPYENIITFIFSHIATRSIVRFFQRFALMQSTLEFDFFRKIRDENTLKVKKKKTIFGGCNLNSCRKKLGKNVSFRRDLDPCLLETSSLEPTNLRSHTAIQLVEGSLIVNSLVPA